LLPLPAPPFTGFPGPQHILPDCGQPGTQRLALGLVMFRKALLIELPGQYLQFLKLVSS
jgi:hypothetical protein